MGGDKLSKRIYKSGGNAVAVKERPPIKCENIVGTPGGETGEEIRGIGNTSVEWGIFCHTPLPKELAGTGIRLD